MEVTGKTVRNDDTSSGLTKKNDVMFCDPCRNEGDEQPAEGFCEDCQEYLCSPCFKIHRRPAVWRHHVLKDKESMPKSKMTKNQVNYQCIEHCPEHPSKILEYFCKTHAQLGCPICITDTHRTCNDVDYIPNIADKFKESSEVNEIFGELQSLKERVETISAKVSNDKKKVKEYENDAKAQILQLRDEFNSICDRLVGEVEDVSQCDEREIESSLKTCDELLKKLRLRESVLEKKQAEMKLSQFFTEAKQSKLSAHEYVKELDMIKEHTTARHYEIKFDPEALREKFKLTFYDTPNEDSRHEQTMFPQTKEIPRGYVLDAICEKSKEETTDFKTAYQWDVAKKKPRPKKTYSKFSSEPVTDTSDRLSLDLCEKEEVESISYKKSISNTKESVHDDNDDDTKLCLVSLSRNLEQSQGKQDSKHSSEIQSSLNIRPYLFSSQAPPNQHFVQQNQSPDMQKVPVMPNLIDDNDDDDLDWLA